MKEIIIRAKTDEELANHQVEALLFNVFIDGKRIDETRLKSLTIKLNDFFAEERVDSVITTERYLDLS